METVHEYKQRRVPGVHYDYTLALAEARLHLLFERMGEPEKAQEHLVRAVAHFNRHGRVIGEAPVGTNELLHLVNGIDASIGVEWKTGDGGGAQGGSGVTLKNQESGR